MIVIVSLYARLKSNFVNLYILLFIGICIMFDNNFIVKYKDVKIFKKKKIFGIVFYLL